MDRGGSQVLPTKGQAQLVVTYRSVEVTSFEEAGGLNPCISFAK